MSKKFFLLLVLTAAVNSNQILAAEICDIADTIEKDKGTMLGGIFNSLSNFTRFGQKEQNTITNNSTSKQKKVAKSRQSSEEKTSIKKYELKKDEKATDEITDWCGTENSRQINHHATLFGISCNKKELMYFGAGAVALITLGGIVYVLKNKDKNNWTLEKVSRDMKQFAIDHKTAIKSSIITAVILGFIALYIKRQGINFESASNWTMNWFVTQSTSTHHVSVLK